MRVAAGLLLLLNLLVIILPTLSSVCSSLDGPFCEPLNGRAIPSRLVGLRVPAATPTPAPRPAHRPPPAGGKDHPYGGEGDEEEDEDEVRATLYETMRSVLGIEGTDSDFAEALEQALLHIQAFEAAGRQEQKQEQKQERTMVAGAGEKVVPIVLGDGSVPSLVARATLRRKRALDDPDTDDEILSVVEMARPASSSSPPLSDTDGDDDDPSKFTTHFRFDLGGTDGVVVEVVDVELVRGTVLSADVDAEALAIDIHRVVVHVVAARKTVALETSKRYFTAARRVVRAALDSAAAAAPVLNKEGTAARSRGDDEAADRRETGGEGEGEDGGSAEEL
jgi:hypothetical protein